MNIPFNAISGFYVVKHFIRTKNAVVADSKYKVSYLFRILHFKTFRITRKTMQVFVYTNHLFLKLGYN